MEREKSFYESVTAEFCLADVCETANPWLPVDAPVTSENCRISAKGAEKIFRVARQFGLVDLDDDAIDWSEILDNLKEKEAEILEWQKEIKECI